MHGRWERAQTCILHFLAGRAWESCLASVPQAPRLKPVSILLVSQTCLTLPHPRTFEHAFVSAWDTFPTSLSFHPLLVMSGKPRFQLNYHFLEDPVSSTLCKGSHSTHPTSIILYLGHSIAFFKHVSQFLTILFALCYCSDLKLLRAALYCMSTVPGIWWSSVNTCLTNL